VGGGNENLALIAAELRRAIPDGDHSSMGQMQRTRREFHEAAITEAVKWFWDGF